MRKALPVAKLHCKFTETAKVRTGTNQDITSPSIRSIFKIQSDEVLGQLPIQSLVNTIQNEVQEVKS